MASHEVSFQQLSFQLNDSNNRPDKPSVLPVVDTQAPFIETLISNPQSLRDIQDSAYNNRFAVAVQPGLQGDSPDSLLMPSRVTVYPFPQETSDSGNHLNHVVPSYVNFFKGIELATKYRSLFDQLDETARFTESVEIPVEQPVSVTEPIQRFEKGNKVNVFTRLSNLGSQLSGYLKPAFQTIFQIPVR